ncbi:MAG: chloride channel protein [Halofilum sp. (in: g-proteobacteria)]|nr:chloride channel protein [Halofilum sp. (in: g-proteobacteria)]
MPGLGIDPVLFAVAGMAGMIGATTSAVVTAVVLVFEQTRDHAVILPVILTVGLAYVVRVRLTPESIYTLKLARRGRGMPQSLQAAMSDSLDARRVMNRDFQVVELERLRQWEWQHRPGVGARYTIVTDAGEIVGLAREDPPYLARDYAPEDLVDRDFQLVAPGTRWPVLMRGMKAHGHELLLVARGRSIDEVVGVITPREIARAARDNAELID